MADSDGEYVNNESADEYEDHHVTRERGGPAEDRHGGGGGGADGMSGGRRNHGQHGHGQGHGRDGGGSHRDRERDRRQQQQKQKAKRGGRREGQAAWETVKRSWDAVGVGEAEDGQVVGVEMLDAAEKRRRVLRDTTPLQRGIIRHLVLVLDMSLAMAARDYLPSCYRVALATAAEFVRAFFEQNPISQLAIVGMRDGVAVRISDMGGNPAEHLERLREWDNSGPGAADVEPQGQPSLQNALEMCRGVLHHTPAHGTREVLILFGALLSSDPGDIHDTIAGLVASRIRVSIIGLAAQVAICSEICRRTAPGDDSAYAVALHEVHFRELVLAATTPPPTAPAKEDADDASSGHAAAAQASLLMMGFPSRSVAGAPSSSSSAALSVCACHNLPLREGYACTRCGAKVCRLPAECPACGLTLVLSTHLARSYHHLFPLRNWVEVSWAAAAAAATTTCMACLAPFPEVPPPARIRELQAAAAAASSAMANFSSSSTAARNARAAADIATAPMAKATAAAAAAAAAAKELKGVSESGRYACEVCGHHFCIDCDVFAHEVIHNCPGCQSDTRPPEKKQPTAAAAKSKAKAASPSAPAAKSKAKAASPSAPAKSHDHAGEMVLD